MEFDKAVQDIFFIPRILGTFPFDDNFRFSKKLLAYCCLVRFFSAFGTISSFMYNTPTFSEEEGHSLSCALRSVAVVSVIGENFFTLIRWFLKRHSTLFLMESINEIQRRNRIILKRYHLRLIHYLLFLSFVINILYCAILRENTVKDMINEISYFLSSSSTMSFVGQFWDILHLLGYLFRESTPLYDESSVINYERFLTLCETTNEIYGSQILFSITESFLQIVIYFYILLLPMFPGFNSSNIMIMAQIINCIIPIVSIILACNYYIKKERNFNEDLKRRMIDEKSRVLLKNEKLKFHFVVGQETTFTACGFFNIDMSLICSMISAATTYLVIVLQYNSDDHPISNLTSTTISPANV